MELKFIISADSLEDFTNEIAIKVVQKVETVLLTGKFSSEQKQQIEGYLAAEQKQFIESSIPSTSSALKVFPDRIPLRDRVQTIEQPFLDDAQKDIQSKADSLNLSGQPTVSAGPRKIQKPKPGKE